MSILDPLIAHSLPWVPRSLLWPVARRYIAGATTADAIACAGELAGAGCRSTLDILGEDVGDERQAAAAAAAYCALLGALEAAGVRAGISIKLSQLGARLDAGLALANARRVAAAAAAAGGRFVRIDMEDSSLTSATLGIYRALLAGAPAGARPRIGIVLQAALHRSADDLESLLPLAPDVRVCKGIYREAPEIASADRQEVRRRFLALVDRLLEGGGTAAAATHDPPLVDGALDRLRALPESDRARHEVQMLLGVGEALRPRVLAAGVRLRVYVPFGEAWHAYSLRRLRENPTIARYVIGNLLRRRRVRAGGFSAKKAGNVEASRSS